MKTKFINTMLFAFLGIGSLLAQNVTTVRANSSDISDNLDLQAVASIFGDSRDLEDFERRLNDPNMMISNLDLNQDGRVDYLRVVELAEQNTHVIVLQSVLGPDMFQDVATVEVERDRYNNVTVQVVGDPYIYGTSYIYQPVYVTRPALFGLFWVSTYRPYYSPWYWDYYPTYYSYWAPCAPYRYHNHVNVYINYRNTYTYVNVRHSSRAMSLYSPRRSNAYERENPNRSFAVRNNNSRNHYDLQQTRGNVAAGGRSANTRSYSNGNNTRTNRNTRTVNTNGRENGTRTISSTGNRTFNQGNNASSVAPSRSSNNNVTAPSRTLNNSSSAGTRSYESGTYNGATRTTPERSYSTPRTYTNDNSNVRSNSSPARSTSSTQQYQPQQSNRSFSNGATRSVNTPAAPSRSAQPAVRSTPAPSAAPRQNSAPVQIQRGNSNNGNAGGRNGRG